MRPLRRLPVAVLLTAAWILASLAPVAAGELPDVVVSGLVLADDEPVPIASATATVQYPGMPVEDASVVLEAATGEFTITIRGWTDPGPTLLTVDVLGEERLTPDPESDCQLRVVDHGVADVELTAPTATELLVVAEPEVLGTICPSAEPAPTDGPAATMPPTDAVMAPDGPVPAGPAVLTVLAVLASATVTAGVTLRRVSRRGS